MKELKFTGIRFIPPLKCFVLFEFVVEKIRIKQKLHGKIRVLRSEPKDKPFWKKFITKKHHEYFLPMDDFIKIRDLRFSAKLQKQFERLVIYNGYANQIWLADGHSKDSLYDFHYDERIDNIRKSQKKTGVINQFSRINGKKGYGALPCNKKVKKR